MRWWWTNNSRVSNVGGGNLGGAEEGGVGVGDEEEAAGVGGRGSISRAVGLIVDFSFEELTGCPIDGGKIGSLAAGVSKPGYLIRCKYLIKSSWERPLVGIVGGYEVAMVEGD